MNYIYLSNIINIKDVKNIKQHKFTNVDTHLKSKIWNVTKHSDMYPEKFSSFQICKFDNKFKYIYNKNLSESTLNDLWTLYVNMQSQSYSLYIKDNKDMEGKDINLLPFDGILIPNQIFDCEFKRIPVHNPNIIVKKTF